MSYLEKLNKRWTEHDILVLKRVYKDGNSLNYIAGLLARTPEAIQAKLNRLGLYKTTDVNKLRKEVENLRTENERLISLAKTFNAERARFHENNKAQQDKIKELEEEYGELNASNEINEEFDSQLNALLVTKKAELRSLELYLKRLYNYMIPIFEDIEGKIHDIKRKEEPGF